MCLSVLTSLFDQLLTRTVVFDRVITDKSVKNAIFMDFYGILWHYLIKIPTEFFVSSMVMYPEVYLVSQDGSQCCGIFSYLPQLERGVSKGETLSRLNLIKSGFESAERWSFFPVSV